MMTVLVTYSDPQLPQRIAFYTFCIAFLFIVTGEVRNFKYGAEFYQNKFSILVYFEV